MKMILKGLLNKRKLFSNIVIITLLLLALSTMIIINNYQKYIKDEEYSKEKYRTIVIGEFTDTNFLDSYSDNIDNISITSSLNVETNTETKEATLIFKTKDAMEEFIEDCKDFKTLEITSITESNTMFIIFEIISIVIVSAIFILILLLSIDYFRTLKKDISLFKVLGFNKNKILLLLTVLFSSIYMLLYLICYCLSYIIYYLLCKTQIITKYYSLFNINLSLIGILLLASIIALFIAIKSNKKIRLFEI